MDYYNFTNQAKTFMMLAQMRVAHSDGEMR